MPYNMSENFTEYIEGIIYWGSSLIVTTSELDSGTALDFGQTICVGLEMCICQRFFFLKLKKFFC